MATNFIKNIFKKTLEYEKPIIGEVKVGKKNIEAIKPQSARYFDDNRDDIMPSNVTEKDMDEKSFGRYQQDSTAIENYRYDPKKKILWITFVGGDTEYAYPDVPKTVVEGLSTAQSKGQYVDEVVKKYAVEGFRAN